MKPKAITKKFPVTGSTYVLRHQLKSLGCFWSDADRCWFAPDAETQAEALRLVEPLSESQGFDRAFARVSKARLREHELRYTQSIKDGVVHLD